MLGPVSAHLGAGVSETVAAQGMAANLVDIKVSDNPINTLEPAISSSDLFIPLPDSRLINLATARWVLQLGYRHKTPVIAFSGTYVDAGALAAVYSSPDDVVKQAAELLQAWAVGVPGKGTSYEPAYFSIKFNRSVASALGIQLKEEKYYREKL